MEESFEKFQEILEERAEALNKRLTKRGAELFEPFPEYFTYRPEVFLSEKHRKRLHRLSRELPRYCGKKTKMSVIIGTILSKALDNELFLRTLGE